MLLAVVAIGVGAQTNQTLAIINTTVIDGTGSDPRAGMTVIVSGERITALGPSNELAVPPTARVIDATGKFVIPGLWDTHVHTRYEGIDHLRLLVANGVTSARNMSGPWEHLKQVREWRAQIASGDRIGPRLLTAGPVTDGPGSGRQTNLIVNGRDEAREAVRSAKRDGADFIKVYNLLSPESYFAIVAEANEQSLRFEGHVPLAIPTLEAVEAGQRSIEHQQAILLGASDQEPELRKRIEGWRPSPGIRTGPINAKSLIDSFSSEKLDVLIAGLLQHQTAVVPTLVAFWQTFEPPDQTEGIRYLPPGYLGAWKQTPTGTPFGDDLLLYEHFQRVLQTLSAAGVTILAGTDVGNPFQVPGFSLHEELSLMVGAGIPPMRVLQAATRDPARAFGLLDQGTIAAGMRADIVLLDANPLDSIENTRRISAVIVNGRMLERQQLDAMLSDIESASLKWVGTPTR